jgi:hypothetical protein
VDSRELFDIINPFDRTAADALMMRVLAWVQRAVPIEYVYTPQQMGEWALRNGWRQHDDAKLCALLRRAQAYVVLSTPLSREITDALYARRALQ